MDIVSLAVTVLAIYGMMQRSPSLAGETDQVYPYVTPPTTGIDPVVGGGAVLQYLSDAWRDAWEDLDEKRRADHTSLVDDLDDGWEWLNRQIEAELADFADQQRKPPPTPQSAPGGKHSDDEPISVVHDSDEYAVPPPRRPSSPPPGPSTAPPPGPTPSDTTEDRGPIRVPSQLGDPITEPKPEPPAPSEITAGGDMSNALAVTGVVSGAAEARAIRRDLDAATAEYAAHLARLRRRIHALGEQTLGEMQLSARSRVIHYTAVAAESTAAAQATAKACSDEVTPLLDSIAREFNRLNS